MKKLLYVFALVCIGALGTACEQEDVKPSDELEITDQEYTEESGGEEDSGIKGKPIRH